MSDGLDTREEHAKVAYQFRGIINELYLTDLKKKTHRGQMGQVLGGFSVGSRGYGYASVPDGETKHDKKGRLRADGFKLVIVPEEVRIIQRIFRDFIDGKAVTKIAKEMNDEHVPTKARLKGGWNVSTISRILKVPVSGWTPSGPVAKRASCASEVPDGSTTAQQAGVEADRSGVAAVRAA